MAKTYEVTRQITIDAPVGEVFAHVADFHLWPAWSPWEDIDPGMSRSYAGAESGVGAAYAWSGNRKAGSGSMEILEASQSEQQAVVDIDLKFVKPFKAQNDCRFEFASLGEATTVTWIMTGAMTPATRMFSLVKSMDSLLGPDFEKGLTRLKAVAEKG